MSKQIIGIVGLGSVEIERIIVGGFDGFPEDTYYTIEAATPRLACLVSRVQHSTYNLDRAEEIRARIEKHVKEVTGENCGCFNWI